MKNIVLLGSTGSVGKRVLDVVRQYPKRFRVISLASNENISALAGQINEFLPDEAVISESRHCKKLEEMVTSGTVISGGEENLTRLAESKDADIIFIAISGTKALMPLVAALKAGKTVALASKEPVVSAGEVLMRYAKRSGAVILPVDSEHSAIFQCLEGRTSREVGKLYITGSGGSLWSKQGCDLSGISLEEVLSHPKWEMGKKITVDSSTLMNKGLEVIEARWLFDITPDKIKVIIHPEAIIHSMVEFIDGTIKAGLFFPDMRFPILRALSYPEIISSDFPRVDFSLAENLTFKEPDPVRFPALRLAYEALRSGGTMPAVLNRANEASVGLFLNGKTRFTDIISKVERVMGKHSVVSNPSLDDIIMAEKWAFEEVLQS